MIYLSIYECSYIYLLGFIIFSEETIHIFCDIFPSYILIMLLLKIGSSKNDILNYVISLVIIVLHFHLVFGNLDNCSYYL